MGKSSIKRNYIYNLIYQIFKIVMPIITTPYLARALGAEAIGIYSYTLSIVTYFILLGSLGIATYAQREIAYVQDNSYKRTKVFWEINIIKFITLGISMFAFYFIFASKGEYSLYYKILLIEIIATCFDISWFFQGLEEFKKTIARNIIIKVVSVVFIFVFIKSPNDLWKYVLIYVVSTFLGNISLWFYLPRYIQKIPIKKLNLKQHIKPIIILFIPQIATQIYSVLDKTMIGYLSFDISEVGYYEQSQKVINMLLTVITSLGIVMLPRMSKNYADGKIDEAKKYIKKSFNFVFFIGIPMIFGIIGVARNFVPLFFGAGYEKVQILISLMSIIILFMGISNVLGAQYLLPTKRQKQYTISVLIGAIVNLISNFILIKYYNSIGATIATILAELSVASIQLYLVRKEININQLMKILPNYIISAIIMFIIIIIIQELMPIGVITLITQILLGVLAYLLMLLILKDQFFIKIVNGIIQKLKNIKS